MSSDNEQNIDDSSDLDDLSHFEPDLYPGSDHASDDNMMTPPMYSSDNEDDATFDSAFFANVTQDRLTKPVEEWCTCEKCKVMGTERESVCCNESLTLQRHRGTLKCVTDGDMFNSMVLSEEGLRYSRYLYSLTIDDAEKRERYLKAELTPKKWRFLAYKSFINLISSQDFNMKVRYILPSCVVSAVREKFPNTNGSTYRGFICLGTDDGHTLP